jgi:hypothetical protein
VGKYLGYTFKEPEYQGYVFDDTFTKRIVLGAKKMITMEKKTQGRVEDIEKILDGLPELTEKQVTYLYNKLPQFGYDCFNDGMEYQRTDSKLTD